MTADRGDGSWCSRAGKLAVLLLVVMVSSYLLFSKFCILYIVHPGFVNLYVNSGAHVLFVHVCMDDSVCVCACVCVCVVCIMCTHTHMHLYQCT